MQTDSESRQTAVVKAVAGLLPALDMDKSPPEHAIAVYRTIARVTGCPDPYGAVKREDNLRALAAVPAIESELMAAPAPLNVAVCLAIAANLIDHGAASHIDVLKTVDLHSAFQPAVDHRPQLLARVGDLPPRSQVLYLADNCGEIVYDAKVVELLARRGLKVTVAVRGGPVINDALIEDAVMAGIDCFAEVITSGIACPGTVLDRCSPRLRELFADADLVIAKGQGNYETLSDCGREIFFLLTVKCPVVAAHLNARLKSAVRLAGQGEMVVYHFGG